MKKFIIINGGKTFNIEAEDMEAAMNKAIYICDNSLKIIVGEVEPTTRQDMLDSPEGWMGTTEEEDKQYDNPKK